MVIYLNVQTTDSFQRYWDWSNKSTPHGCNGCNVTVTLKLNTKTVCRQALLNIKEMCRAVLVCKGLRQSHPHLLPTSSQISQDFEKFLFGWDLELIKDDFTLNNEDWILSVMFRHLEKQFQTVRGTKKQQQTRLMDVTLTVGNAPRDYVAATAGGSQLLAEIICWTGFRSFGWYESFTHPNIST